jgi:hypothetical protein
MLLHLVQPFALATLYEALSHVKRFCDHIESLTARGVNAHIATEVLNDLVTYSGVDLKGLQALLLEFLTESKSIEGD